MSPAAILARAETCLRAGQPLAAVDLCVQALKDPAATVPAGMLLSLALEHAGQPDRAETVLAGLAGRPDAGRDCLVRLAVLRLRRGSSGDAIPLLARALRLVADDADVRMLLAQAWLMAGMADRAAMTLRRGLMVRPGWSEGENNLGSLLAPGRGAEPARHFLRAAVADPGNVAALVNLAEARAAEGRITEALDAAGAAARLRPDLSTMHERLGLVRQRAGRGEAAVAALRRAVALAPAEPTHWINLAGVLKPLGRTGATGLANDRAVMLAPGLPAAHRNRGVLLADLDRMAAARRAFDRAVLLDPADTGTAVKAALSFPTITHDDAEIDRIRADLLRRIDRLSGARLGNPLVEVGLPNFYLAYHGRNDRDIQARIAAFYLRACPGLAWRAPHCTRYRRRPGRRLRIGFVSRFFYDHSIRYSTAGILRNLDRGAFEIHVISDLPPDKVTLFPPGQRADRHTVIPLDLEAARRRIAALHLDVLIYADIGMEPLTYYLAFARLAPVQAHLQGHPVSTGIPNMDYFISSDLQEPADCEDHYTETPVRLGGIIFCYDPLPPVDDLPRAAFGLPEGPALYFCPQTLFKFHPTFDAILSGILDGDPDGRLLLLRDPAEHRTAALAARLARTLGPAADRVVWVDRLDKGRYYALLKHAAVMLDTTMFSGANTTIQSLGLGIPAVTLPAPWVRGRMTLGWLRATGLEDLVAETPADYVRIALACGTDPAWRAAVVGRIEASRHLLFGQTGFIRELERFLPAACDAAADGRPRIRWHAGQVSQETPG